MQPILLTALFLGIIFLIPGRLEATQRLVILEMQSNTS
jgi:hypothetical protein